MVNIKISLVSTFRRHGSAGPKPSKVRSTASSKFSAILKSNFISSEEEEDEEEDEEVVETSDSKEQPSIKGAKGKRQPKKYGQHQGNVQVYVLVDNSFETDEELISISNYVTNLTSAFEAKPSFSLKKAKNDYRVYKDEVVAKYAKAFGSQLDEKTTTAMLSELHKAAFVYTSHQIVITISSDKFIEGARPNEEDGLYYITLKSKMIYRKERSLLSPAEIEILDNINDDSVNLTTTSLVRIPVSLRWDSQNERYVIIYPNQGYSVVDGYDLKPSR